jgi:hypothetical protein
MKAWVTIPLIFGVLTAASVLADESLEKVKTELENGLKPLIDSGQLTVTIKPYATE